jgi:hypothetical protein
MRLVRARIAPVAFLAVTLAACGQRMGACEGFSEILNETFCQDVSADECRLLDTSMSHGANWLFHEGQTCAGLGYNVTTAFRETNMSAEAFEAELRGSTPPAATSGDGEFPAGH